MEKSDNIEIRVAVLVITYNQENYIRQTMNSLVTQKCNFSYRIYVNDDSSTDHTGDILREYAVHYPQLIDLQINTKNLGIVGNYYNALERSQSEFIACCAGDDWWCDNYKLQKQVDFMDAHSECGFLYTGCQQYINYHLKNISVAKRYSFIDILSKGNHVPAVTSFYRRSLMKRYIEDVQPLSHDWGMEDQPMILWFSHESQLMSIDDVTAVYRVADGSAYHNSIDKEISMSLRSYDLCRFFVEKFEHLDLLPIVQRKHAVSMVYKYLFHDCPVDDNVVEPIYKISFRDGKIYFLYLLSKVSLLRKCYLKIILRVARL